MLTAPSPLNDIIPISDASLSTLVNVLAKSKRLTNTTTTPDAGVDETRVGSDDVLNYQAHYDGDSGKYYMTLGCDNGVH